MPWLSRVDQLSRNEYPIPDTMKAWVLGGPEELSLVEKPVPEPGAGRGAGADRRDRGLRDRHRDHQHGVPAMIDGGLPFNRGFTPGP